MGNEHSSKQNKYASLNIKKYLENYTYVKKSNDPRYGENDSQEKVALIEKNVNSSKVLVKDLKDLHQRRQLSHPYLIKFHGIASEEHNKFCSTNHKIVAVVEYLEKDLETEIKSRRNQSKLYTEKEIWTLLSQTLSGLAYLHSYKIIHGDIRSGTIFIEKEDIFKIADQALLTSGNSSYIQMIANINANICTLSPELVKNLKNKEFIPQHNAFKSDSFALGMIVLNAIQLKGNDICYDWQNCSFNNDALQKQLDEIKKVYSLQLYEFMTNMLILDEETRPDAVYMNHQVKGIVGETSSNFLTLASPHNSRIESARSHSPISRGNFQDQSKDSFFFNQKSVYDNDISIISNSSEVQVPNYFSNPQQRQKAFVPPKKEDEDKLQTKSHKVKAKKKNKDQGRNQNDYNESIAVTQQSEQIEQHNKQQQLEQQIKKQNELDQQNSILDNINVVQSVVVNEEEIIPVIRQMPPINPDKFMNSNDDQCIWKSVYIEQNGKKELKKLPVFIPKNADPSFARLQNYYPEINFEYPQLNKQIESELEAQQFEEIKQKKKSKKESKVENENYQTNRKERDVTPDFKKSNKNSVNSNEAQNNQRNNAFSFGPTNKIEKGKEKEKEEAKVKVKEEKGSKQKQESNEEESNSDDEDQSESKKNNLPPSYMKGQQQQPIIPGSQQGYGFYGLNQQMGSQGYPYQQHPQIPQNPYQNRQAQQPNYMQFQGQQFNPYQQYPQQQKYPQQQNQYPYQQQPQLSPQQFPQQQPQTQPQKQQQTQPQNQQQVPQNLPQQVQKPDQLQQQFSQLQLQQQYQQQQLLKQQQAQQQSLQQNFPAQQQFPIKNDGIQTNLQNSNLHLSPALGMQREEDIAFIKERYSDNSVYEGQKVGGLRHGKGKFYHADGTIYDGEWKQGLMEGKGILYFSGGKVAYDGQFRNDQFNGKGVQQNENPVPYQGMIDYSNLDSIGDYWIKYDGEFVNNIKQGQGTLYLTNNEKYTGSFQNDNIHGKGQFQRLSDQIIKGEWMNNSLTLVYQS